MSVLRNRWMAGSSPATTIGELHPRKPRLHRIARTVEFAQISEAAHRETLRVFLAGRKECGDVGRHFGARLCTRGGAAIHQEIVGQHDTVDDTFHEILSRLSVKAIRWSRTARSPCWRA